MSLQPGHKLAHYEIIEPIGKGGMGEVYRAKDHKLARDVAIKVLPEEFAQNEERLARFKREAKVLASLNHPNIAAIHGLEESEGTHYLVLELVPGETLAERISRGPIPVEEAIEIASKIAEALEEAHEHGIVHRDLKPANIKQTEDGKIKVLDFGLAKVFQEQTPNADSSMSPTLTRDATRVGVILGTAAYMSPEQAKGKKVDKRTDVWAFGAVLYEMLTGKRAFAGENVSDTLAYVLTKEPEWELLPANTTAALRQVLRLCLTKDAKRRVHDMADVRLAIDGAFETTAEVIAQPASSRPSWALVAAVAITSVAVMSVFAVFVRTSPTGARVQLDVVTPFTDEAASLAISPDGTRIVFVARSEGVSQLWLRSLQTGASRPLPGTEGARMPFWSPDGGSIGFFAFEQLKRVDLAGGSVQLVTSVLSRGGGSWGDNDEILYGALGGIYSIPASGGERTLVLAPEEYPWDNRFPQWLPGNDTFIYWRRGLSDENRAALYISSLDGSLNQRLATSETGAFYIASGHLAFVRGGILYVQVFDAAGQQMVGDPMAIGEVIVNFWQYPAVSASRDGTLIYRATGGENRQALIRLDRSGNALATLAPDVETPAEPELSPSGERIAMTSVDPQGAADIWVFDEVLGSSQRMTFDGADDFWPVWSPDGSLLAFGTVRNFEPEIWTLPSDQSSPAEPLEPNGNHPNDWSPNGEFLLYSLETTKADLWVTPLEGDQAGRPFLYSRFNETHGQFSPDGQWVAYHSDASGRSEIYVTPFPGPGGVQIISTAGGVQPRWRGDGKVLELFFLRLDNTLMAVTLEPSADGSRLIPGTPEVLFVTRIAGGAAQPFDFKQFYDVAPDGQSFVMVVTTEDQTTEPITVILNWDSESAQ